MAVARAESAVRNADEANALGSFSAGPVKVRTATEVGSTLPSSTTGGGTGTSSAIRACSAGSSPMWKSAPRGPAISPATNAPGFSPVTRRITSPIRCPYVIAW